MKPTVCALLACGVTMADPASAFVANPVGGRPGELDVEARLTAERGKIEPNENKASFQKAEGFYEYLVGAGYTWGHYGPLQFFSTRLELTHYESPSERNDPDRWFVGDDAPPSDPARLEPRCAEGARYLGGGLCELHPADTGFIATASTSFALVHDPDFALGTFLRFQIPFGWDEKKFANPRLDYFSTGWNVGVELTSFLTYESGLFVGLGTRPFSTEQNGTVISTNLLHFRARSWILPWKAGLKLGPYMEGDLHERFDPRYDAAYTPQVLAQPGDGGAEQGRNRIRAARFASALLGYFLVTEHLSVELGYVQKWFGYAPRATQAYFLGMRGLIEVL